MTTPPPSLLLSLLPDIGAASYWQCIEHFGSAENTLRQDLSTFKTLNNKALELLRGYQENPDHSELMAMAEKHMDVVDSCGAICIDHENSAYPALLKQTHRAPSVLFAKGNRDLMAHPQIAVVGTRNPTRAGEDNAYQFSRFLSASGITVTSGLALGIDACAHRGAKTEMGKTIAVMATGIESVYPKQHRRLAEEIIDEGGLLITESFPQTKPLPAAFPRRNRIISGLSMGTLVVEAAVKSGSLITAKNALEQNREVFGIPSSIHNPQGRGCHALIKQGAHLVETAQDIIDQCQPYLDQFAIDTSQIKPKEEPEQSSLNESEAHILRFLSDHPVKMDELIALSQRTAQEVSSTLMILCLKGYVNESVWGFEKATKR